MDPEVSLLLHCADWEGLAKSQVEVELSERYNRWTDPTLEDHIEKLWKERTAREPWLFNGAKFRLHSFSVACPKSSACHESVETCIKNHKDNPVEFDCRRGDAFPVLSRDGDVGKSATAVKSKASQRPGCVLSLRLGLTSYKDYLGTNWSGQAGELCRRGQVEFGDPQSLLAQPLGVGAVVCTADEQIVFIRRSQTVAEAGGLLDIPGGHPEPKVVCKNLGVKFSEDEISLIMLSPVAVVTELFSSVCAEIHDEINIPLKFLGEPLLMGIALNHTSAGRPSAEFYVSCSLTSDQVKVLYLEGGAEANESTDIIFVNKKIVLQLDQKSSLWPELCPSAKGAVLLYQTVKPDMKDQA